MDDEFDQWQQAVPVQSTQPPAQPQSFQVQLHKSQEHKSQNDNNNELKVLDQQLKVEVQKPQRIDEQIINQTKQFKINTQIQKDDDYNQLFQYKSQPTLNLFYNSFEQKQKVTITKNNSLNISQKQYINLNNNIQKQFKQSTQKNIHNIVQQTNVQLMPYNNSNFQQSKQFQQQWQEAKIQPPQQNPSYSGFSSYIEPPNHTPINSLLTPQQNKGHQINNDIQNKPNNQTINNDDDQFGQFQQSTPLPPSNEPQTKVSQVTQIAQEKKTVIKVEPQIPPYYQHKQEKKQPEPYIQPQMSVSGVFQRPKIKKPVYSQTDMKRAAQLINKIPDYSYISAAYFIE